MESQKTPLGRILPAPHKPCLSWEGRQSVCGSVSLHDLPRHSQLFTNTCLLLGGAMSWNLAMALGLELISGGIAWERRAQFL